MPDPRAIDQSSLLGRSQLRDLSDEDVMQEVAFGNGDALAVLLERHKRLIYSIAVKIVKDEAEAEDVVQIVFLDIFRKAALFDPLKGSLKVWLMRYAYTRSINGRYRLQRRHFYSRLDLEEVDAI